MVVVEWWKEAEGTGRWGGGAGGPQTLESAPEIAYRRGGEAGSLSTLVGLITFALENQPSTTDAYRRGGGGSLNILLKSSYYPPARR